MNIVQARCPHCGNQLRIPADWLERPMRCKHCKKTFQAKAKAPEPAASAPAPKPAPPVPAVPPASVPDPGPAYQYPSQPAGVPTGNAPAGWPAMPPGAMPHPGWAPGAMPPGMPQYYQPAPGMPPMMYPPGYAPPGYAPPGYPAGYGMPGYPQPGMMPYPPPASQAPASSFGFDESASDVESESDIPFSPPASAASYAPPAGSGFAAVDSTPRVADTVAVPRRRPPPKKKNQMIGLAIVGVLFVLTVIVLAVIYPSIRSAMDEDANKSAQSKKDKQKSTKEMTLAEANAKYLKQQIEELKKKGGAKGGVVNPANPGTGTRPPGGGAFAGLPRRALFIAPENYLNLNSTLWYQDKEGTGSNISNALVYRFTQGAPLNLERNQVFVLTDSSEDRTPGAAPQKETIEAAIKDFCESSRAQDRIILFYSGHACEIDGKGYLIPLEGDTDDKNSCIPIDWVYEQLAKSKARQKVFFFDAFRFPPARGLELPSTGPMTEAVDKQLENPPPGVQVVTACVKDQQALEFESGSLFQTAFREALRSLALGAIVQAKDPLPIKELVDKANEYMAKELNLSANSMMMDKEADKDAPPPMKQTARLSGKEPETGVEPNPAEPGPVAVAFRITDKGGASSQVIASILDEIKRFPPMKKSQAPQLANMSIAALPGAGGNLDEFKDDGFNPFDSKYDAAAVNQMRDKFPLRVISYEISNKLNEFMELPMKEYFANPGGPLDAKAKARFLEEQKDPALATLAMEELLDDAKRLADDRDEEKSKRWQAHFDLSVARLQARLVYVYEYNNLIALIRSDALPTLEPFHSGWRVNTSNKIQIKESTVKDMAKQTGRLWERMIKEYANTPWAIVAKREKNVSMGLKWVPTRN